jgi:YrhK-like protein
VSSYVELPEGWTRVSASGPGPFVTSEVLRGPDGAEHRWESRRHRKRSRARRRGGGADGAAAPSVWWRPHRRGWWMAVLFAVGSLCFAAGGVASQWAATPRPWIGVTFFVGSLFFTSAAYLQYAEAVNAERGIGPRRHGLHWRPASWEPARIDWLATVVQLIGTVLFNISTFSALSHSLTTHQTNARVWAPDAFGSIAFLIASELAFAEVCHRWICWRNRALSWKIVALNLLGSIAFGASAVASLVEPSSGEPVSARIANAGTSVGAVCFLVGALLLMPEAAREERPAPSPDRDDAPGAKAVDVVGADDR